MNVSRLAAVFGQELRHTLRRPLFWTLLGMVGLLAWGMSTGTVQLGTGSAMVGGRKAWLTSEFSNAFILSVMAASFYSFFVSIATGLAAIRDNELKLDELLHSTRLTAGEYVWGKALAYLTAFSIALGLQLLFMVFFNHVLPNPEVEQIRGPFHLAAYLRPAVVFAMPTLVFFAGISFFIGERWRRSGLVFLFPTGVLMALFSFLWNWAPTWLDLRINRILMFLDPTGFRWLNETWLKLDRGTEFYNEAAIGLDSLVVANRLVVLGLGLLGIWGAQRHLAATLRGVVTAGRAAKKPAPAAAIPASVGAVSQHPVGFWTSVGRFARLEAAMLLREPGLYLFSFFVLSQTLANALVRLGAFQTPILLTPGQFAMGSLNTLTLLLSLLMMLFLVESLAREETTGLRPILFGSPTSTGALLLGKTLGVSTLAGAVLVVAYLGGTIAMLIQGEVAPNPTPIAIVWLMLLVPTFLVWSAFVTAVYALVGNRFAAYGVCLGAIAFTLYRQLTGQMNWVGNWFLWTGGRWSDISVLEIDRQAIVLNRIMVLGLAALFFVIAVRVFQRRAWDPTRTFAGLSPKALARTGLRLAPWTVVPLAAGMVLWLAVLDGHAGERTVEARRDYWKQNLNTWRDVRQPSIAAVDLDVALDPAGGRFTMRGSYELENHHAEALSRFALTGGDWDNVQWRFGEAGTEPQAYEPEDRSGLYVFTPGEALEPGARVKVAFEYEGRHPSGISENGEQSMEFILPSAVVLGSFSPSFVPLVGYDESIGVDDDNRAEAPGYVAGRHEEQLDALFGSPRPFTTSIRVTAPADFTVNSVGTLVSESVSGDRRTSEWRSDYPVRFFNIVAGRWQVREGEGTAIYYHPEHAYNLDEMSRALEGARRYYSEWFYPYPWETLKLSEFPAIASYAQGFPTNITFSEGLGFLTRRHPKINSVLLVVAHESAHQWWGNLLTPGDGTGGGLLSEAMSHFSTLLLTEQLEGEGARMEFAQRLEEWYGDRRFRDEERPLVEIDGRRRTDTTITYDKGGLVMWMLLEEMGRENLLAGLREFIVERMHGPDYPLLEDMLATLRTHAPDVESFDRFVEQWFFDVVAPEYRLTDARSRQAQLGWITEAVIENAGDGLMPVEVAVVNGKRFDDEGLERADYLDERTTVLLAPGESTKVELISEFEPTRIVVDPDVHVLQLRRKAAAVAL